MMTSTTTGSPAEAGGSLKTWRRVAIIAVIGSFSFFALVGIVSLLAGSFGEMQGQVLVTTAVFGTFSGLALCHLGVAATPFRLVGALGLAASVVALACGLSLIWGDGTWGWTDVWRTYGVSSVLAITAAQVNLLLLLGRRRQPVVRKALVATIVLAGLLAVLIIMWILLPSAFAADNMRLLGIIAILDVLGTIVTPVTAALLKDPQEIIVGLTPVTFGLAPRLVVRLDAFAHANGETRNSALARILDAALPGEGAPGDDELRVANP